MNLLIAFTIFTSIGFGRQDVISELLERMTTTEEVENIAIISITEDPFEYLQNDFSNNIPCVIYKKGNAGMFNKDIRKVLRRNLFFIVCCNVDESTLVEAGSVLQRLHSSKGLFIDNSNSTKSTEFFQWCWKNGFLDVLLWTRSSQNHILRYEQFPNFRTFKIEDVIKDDLFDAKKQLENLNGYPIRTIIANEPPRVIKYFNSRTNRTMIGGYFYDTFYNFVKNLNATFTQKKSAEKYDMDNFVKRVISKEVDICANPYVAGENYSHSFPLKTCRWDLMVPVVAVKSPYQYFILPFEGKVWVMVVLTLFYVSVMSSVMEFLVSGKFKWMQCFCEVLLRFLNMSSEAHLYNGFMRILALKLQVFLFAFVMNNLYLALLTTFLATDLPGTNIETLDELTKRNFKILGFQNVSEGVLKTINNATLTELFVIVTVEEINHSRDKLRNSSFAYSVADDKTYFILKQQERLKRPVFHVMEHALSVFQFGFMVPFDSPFLSPLNDFVMKIHDSGLLSKWQKDGIEHGKLSGVLEFMSEVDYGPYRPLHLLDLQFAWLILLFGGISTVLVFSMSWVLHFVTYSNSKTSLSVRSRNYKPDFTIL